MKVTDIETDALLDTVSKFHCAVIIDYFTKEETWYRPWDFEQYIKDLEEEAAKPDGLLAFHNGIKYDHPALSLLAKKHLKRDINIPEDKVFDTLVACRLIYSNIKDTDAGLLRSGRITGKLYGSHALKAWGMRLGFYKGDYGEQEAAWEAFNEPMMEYCAQDVRVTMRLLEKIMGDTYYFPKEGDWLDCIRLEHKAAWALAEMERNGFPFDTEGAERLYSELASERELAKIRLLKKFGSWYSPKGGTQAFLHPITGIELHKYPRVKYPKAGGIYKKNGKSLDTRLYVEGCPYTPVEFVTFNPSSRQHIIKVLIDNGWEPIEFTDAGQPVVDDEQLSHVRLEDPDAQECIELIRRYLMLQKRIGQLAEGDNAWLRLVKSDGMIHGSVNPNGAVTGRATHAWPNIAQVPSSGAEYGKECRGLFGASHYNKDWYQVGVDASGLELRCLGHFMSPYDDGAYIDVILNGDIHWTNAIAAGLAPDVPRDKHNPNLERCRDNAKTFIYGFLYGAGAAKIGLIVNSGKERGKELINTFLDKTPAIKSLREAVQETLVAESKWVGGENVVKWKRRWVRGLDGRKVHVRSPHAALNTLLQSAGALICKLWVIKLVENIKAAGYKSGWDGDFCLMAWVHDEVQVAARTEAIAKHIVEICQTSMREVGEHFKFRCQLDTEGKIGKTWADCH